MNSNWPKTPWSLPTWNGLMIGGKTWCGTHFRRLRTPRTSYTLSFPLDLMPAAHAELALNILMSCLAIELTDISSHFSYTASKGDTNEHDYYYLYRFWPISIGYHMANFISSFIFCPKVISSRAVRRVTIYLEGKIWGRYEVCHVISYLSHDTGRLTPTKVVLKPVSNSNF